MTVVLAVTGVVFQRIADTAYGWIGVAGVALWFGVFLWLLIGNPKTAFKWIIVATPVLPLGAIIAAFVATR